MIVTEENKKAKEDNKNKKRTKEERPNRKLIAGYSIPTSPSAFPRVSAAENDFVPTPLRRHS